MLPARGEAEATELLTRHDPRPKAGRGRRSCSAMFSCLLLIVWIVFFIIDCGKCTGITHRKLAHLQVPSIYNHMLPCCDLWTHSRHTYNNSLCHMWFHRTVSIAMKAFNTSAFHTLCIASEHLAIYNVTCGLQSNVSSQAVVSAEHPFRSS